MDDNLRGSLWMIAAMAAFAIEDALFKLLTREVPVGQALVLFGLAGSAVFLVLIRRAGERVHHPALRSRALVLRAVCEVGGRVFFALAIALTPLSSASAILQATPLIVTLGAVAFFGERVGWRRWTAIGIGFVGVLLIVRPGTAGFDASALLAVAATLGFAGRDLATRASPATMSNRQLGLYGFAALTVAGALLVATVDRELVRPDAAASSTLLAVSGFGVVAYLSLTTAVRRGDLAVISPFRYTRLVFAMLLGALVFAERPDAATLLGSAIIVASGLYTLLRARRTSGGPSRP